MSSPYLDALVRKRRALLRRRAPAVTILCGPASDEDRAYYAHTDPDALSSHDLARALRALGASDVTLVDVTTRPRWLDAIGNEALVVVNLHGSPGEDGVVQGALRSRALRFVGSDVEASVLALNKGVTKLLAVALGIPTPGFSIIGDGVPVVAGADPAGQRFCKPLRGGSSLGARRLCPGEPLPSRGDWLVEDFVDGIDATVAIVDGESGAFALPAIILEHDGAWYDADRKLVAGAARPATATRPPALAEVLAACEAIAVRMHAALGAADISRSDFVVGPGGPRFLEMNTLPGLSARGNVAECARAAGLDYLDLVALVVGSAFQERTGRSGCDQAFDLRKPAP